MAVLKRSKSPCLIKGPSFFFPRVCKSSIHDLFSNELVLPVHVIRMDFSLCLFTDDVFHVSGFLCQNTSQALDSGTHPPTYIAYVLFPNSSMSTHKFALFMISVPAVR